MASQKSDFDKERELFDEVERAHQALVDRLEVLSTALRLPAETKADTERADSILHLRSTRAKAREHEFDARYRPERLKAEIREIDIQLMVIAPQRSAAHERWAIAQQRETDRIAKTLAQQQRPVIKRIDQALQELDAAIADANGIHGELGRKSPGIPIAAVPYVYSDHLPNVTQELGFGLLRDERSPASAWRRRMLQKGLL